ncbi:hypothetical protein [Chitinophaga sancti]|uniref:Lipoprotein n=1 Tax=Chitinophaga sancti TaxID=1004 RepID=A0A1K1Q8J1_9BACT|nr:hypothetical protein [Chitinophaga sancti]WQD61223.1 hypothetical protein U0033_25400 [Chitinophaga sancti]WQG86650.1 hypothetical protein SR876_17065 [Chitinophaga sancti]SFW56009.1 hypothetical protein SAMN05661012_02528 [Chitinophaga sancti]
MKNVAIIIGGILLMSCRTTIKMSIPEVFKEQATMEHVKGTGTNKMSFGKISTSKIKRGAQISGSGWQDPYYFPENILLNQIGIQKSGSVDTEKGKFRYLLSNGKDHMEIFATEHKMVRTVDYEAVNIKSVFNSFEQVQQYDYIFSAIIKPDTARKWELVMTNNYDRYKQGDTNPFSIVKRADHGLATNGEDTIYVKPLSLEQTESVNGKLRKLPFTIMSGYELSTSGGVIAVVDMIDKNIWFYNELDETERLQIGAIGTALFARKIHNVNW